MTHEIDLQDEYSNAAVSGRHEDLAGEISALRSEVAVLRAQEERYRLLATCSPDWIYWLAPNGEFVFISSACERITGYPPQRFYDDPLFTWAIVHPDDVDMLKIHTRAHKDGEHEALYFRIFHADGGMRWILHTCSPIFDDAGTYQGRRGLNRDVTEQVLAEQALKRSDARYKAMFEGIDSGVAVYKVIGDGDGFVFTEFNRAAEILDGLHRGDVLGRRIEEVFPQIDKFGLVEVFKRVYATGDPEKYPAQCYVDNRISQWVENYVYKLASNELVAVFTDRTVEKRLEQELLFSQQRFADAVAATSDGIWEWHIPSGRVYFSPRYLTMLGYAADEFEHSQETFKALTHPDDYCVFMATVSQHFEMDEGYSQEIRMRAKTGEWRWLMDRGCVVERDAERRPVRMAGTHVDIHERKQIDEQLKRSLHELEALNILGQNVSLSISLEDVVNAAMGWVTQALKPNLAVLYLVGENKLELLDWRVQGIVFDASRAWSEELGGCLWGLAAAENIIYCEDVGTDKRCLQAMCLQAGIHSCVRLPLLSRGQCVAVLLMGSIANSDFSSRENFLRSMGALISTALANALLHQRTLVHADDLEEMVAARTEELEKFYNAVEHSPVSIVITDIDGTIEYVNPFFCSLTGYALSEIAGQNPRLLKSGLHDEEFYAQLWATISQGKTWRGEMCNRKKNGRIFWELVAIAPVCDASGRVIHYVAIKEDVSDKKDLERLKEDVDQIMRHDLKTPLNAIIGLPQVLAMDGNLTVEQLEVLSALEDSGRKMLGMIDQSLDIFKMEMETYEYWPRSVDAIAVIMQLLRQNISKLSAKKMRFTVCINGQEAQNNEKFMLEAEEQLLYALLSNVIINAIEASPPGGEVGVELEDVPNSSEGHFSGGQSAPLACLRVRNTGAVPEQIRGHFFEKYKTFGKKTGTGLGTYSAKLVAATMGYEISMQTSDVDNETVISILAPRIKSGY